jgi:ketosteroid isomerase-like protein
MDREEILKLLKALGIKVSTDGAEGTMKEDDAVKLVEDQFKASNLGLIQKRDELLAQEVELKKKITTLETAGTEAAKKMTELDAQLKKNNPEEYKKFYEVKAAELETEHKKALEAVEADRDKYRESHFSRVRDDAINEAVKDIQFMDNLRPGFIALAMTQNQFKPTEIDGKTLFLNQDNKTLQAVLHELSLSNEGKAYIKNGNQGGGAHGGTDPGAAGQGGQKMNRKDFMVLSPQAQMDFINKNGTLTD